MESPEKPSSADNLKDEVSQVEQDKEIDKKSLELSPTSGQLIGKEVIKHEYARADWKNRRELSDTFRTGTDVIDRLVQEYLDLHPEAKSEDIETAKKKETGFVTVYYSPKVQSYLEEKLRVSLPPSNWVPFPILVEKLGISAPTVVKLVNAYSKDFPKIAQTETGTYKEEKGHRRLFYSPLFAELLKKEFDKYPAAPQNWKTQMQMASEEGVDFARLDKFLKEYSMQHSQEEHKGMFRNGRNQVYEHYSPQVAAYIHQELQRYEDTPEGWINRNKLAKRLNVVDATVQRIIDSYLATHPNSKDVKKAKSDRGLVLNVFSPVIQEYVAATLAASLESRNKEKEPEPSAPEDWKMVSDIASELKVSRDIVTKTIKEYFQTHSEEGSKKKYPATTSWKTGSIVTRPVVHYSPAVVDYCRTVIEGLKSNMAQEGWLTVSDLQEVLGISWTTINSLIKKYQTQSTDPQLPKRRRNPRGKMWKYYPPVVVEWLKNEVAKHPRAPKDWKILGELSEQFSVSQDTLRRLVERQAALNPDSVVIKELRNDRGVVCTFYSPETILQLKQSLEQHTKGKSELENKLTGLLANPEKEEGRKFREMLGLFGPSNFLDILYVLHPEFRDLPVDHVKGKLTEYLGNYLLTAIPFSVDALEKNLPSLKQENLRRGLAEVIKGDCLNFYLLEKKQSPLRDDLEIFQLYFDDLTSRTANNQNLDLNQVVAEVREYYQSVTGSWVKPTRIIESLSADRPFPDIYQQINRQEIKDKKRLLIADEMGVGKSASVILAKESLGVKTALAVVPSNVVATWEKYLSDTVGDDGRQLGYFKPGQAPRVLTIRSSDDLMRLNDGYDYILISQERLNDANAEELQKLDYGMLIVDEVHKLKNVRDGKRANHLLNLAEKIEGDDKYLVMLSGTPVPNKVEDVAMLLKLLHPDRFAQEDSKRLVSAILNGSIVNIRSLLIPHMQMKGLAEHVEMPNLTEATISIPLSRQEEDIYQVLLEEDELTPTQKLQILRQFLLNHRLLDITPGVPEAKIEKTQAEISKAFETNNKVILFVNDYIEGVLRGENSVLSQLALPPGVIVRAIHGNTSPEERQSIQEELNNSSQRLLLAVSGNTADVGVDYSGAERVFFYNEPWTKAAYEQQLARVYRPGVTKDIQADIFVTEGTLEQGIHHYVEVKNKAIEKLLKGIPITELEAELLKASERGDNTDLDVNPELAQYYFSSFDKLNRIFASVKEIGEKNFTEFLQRHGEEYAECYLNLGSRSYQSNASRVSATVISALGRQDGIENPKILDIASGPEMLKKHSGEGLQKNITSLDINPAHFKDSEEGTTVVGSFTKMPFPDGSFDYTNLSLALQYTKFVPSRGEYERIRVLKEAARVLKTGGKLVLNMPYSLDFKNYQKFKEFSELFGLRVVDEYSDEVQVGNSYHSRVITLQKVEGIDQSIDEIIRNMFREDWDGLKLVPKEARLKDSRKIISQFKISNKQLDISFNEQDKKIIAEERDALEKAADLKEKYGAIDRIDGGQIQEHGFVRLKLDKKYILFKKLSDGSVVIVK